MQLKPIVAALSLAFSLPLCAATLPRDGDRALRELLDRGKQTHSAAVVVWQDGHEIGHYYPGDRVPGPIELMSVTKSVVALAIGQLIGDGRIKSLDQPIADFYPEWRQGRKKDITLRMVMSHTSGLQDLMTTNREVYPAPDAIQLALAAELASTPGTSVFYSNKAVNVLSGVIEKASGVPMDTFLKEGLFKAMEIHPGDWGKDDAGHPYAMADAHLTATDEAKLGQLVLDRGSWQGKRLLPAAYIDQMLGQPNDHELGLLWWQLPQWRHFDADPSMPAMLRGRGVPEATVAKLEAGLRGKNFSSEADMFAGLHKALGSDAANVLQEQLVSRGIGPYRLFNRTKGPVVGYEGNGDGGQRLVVIPAARLVVVRQIEESSGEEDDDEGYADLVQRIMTLAEAEGRLPL